MRAKGDVMERFFLDSPDVDERFHLPQVYPMCGGENISPELKWGNIPKGTQSFAITMFDPDAPTDHGWWHWMVINIPANVTFFPRNTGSPKSEFFDLGFQTINDYGEIGYGGPCPPPGPAHRYIITIYALEVKGIEVPQNINPQILAEEISKRTIDATAIMGLYQRGWR